MKRLFRLRHLLALAALVPSLLLVVSLTTSPVLAACALSAGSTTQYWVDGVYYNSSNVSGTRANLGSFNPDPVFSTYAEGGTSFWVMIARNVSNPLDDRVAQIGWMKASAPGSTRMFSSRSGLTAAGVTGFTPIVIRTIGAA